MVGVSGNLARYPLVCSSVRRATLPTVCRRVAVAVAAVALSAASAAGQRISGAVVDGVNFLPVADLPVVATTAKGEVAGAGRTHSDGTFSLALTQPGAYTLRVLHMGYRPTELSFEVKDTATVRVRVELSLRRVADVTLLTTVVIRGQQVQVPSRFADVLERARTGHGALFTRADFAMTNDVAFALNRLPTVHANSRGIVFGKCNTSMPGAARVQVYVNGARLFAPGDSPEKILKLVAPADIELMEVYTGVARLPAEYINDACAVIAIWTK